MVTRQDIFNINFYKKEIFHGSIKNLCYQIRKAEIEGQAEDETQTVLEVATWPGPYNFETTPEEEKTYANFPFSNEGLEEIAAYLNTTYQKNYL